MRVYAARVGTSAVSPTSLWLPARLHDCFALGLQFPSVDNHVLKSPVIKKKAVYFTELMTLRGRLQIGLTLKYVYLHTKIRNTSFKLFSTSPSLFQTGRIYGEVLK